MSVTAKSARVDVVAYYREIMGVAPAKSWSREKIMAAIESNTVSRSGKVKTALKAKFEEKFGKETPKSYTGSQIAACLKGDKTPRFISSNDSRTVAELRKIATQNNIKGRSSMNKAQLVAAVDALTVRKVA